jgi:hypothetical protein
MVAYSVAFRMREGNFAIFGEVRTVSRSTFTAFDDHKSPVKPMKSQVITIPRFPRDFPFPMSHSRSQIPKHKQIYYLDRY